MNLFLYSCRFYPHHLQKGAIMTLDQLKYFETAARTLHIGKAAQMLNISQPSLSISIKNWRLSWKYLCSSRKAEESPLPPMGRSCFPMPEVSSSRPKPPKNT